jgi:uncharacterized protein involved in exopolysaccharide biosynthesis
MSAVPETGEPRSGEPRPTEDSEPSPIRLLPIVNTLLRGRWIVVGVAGTITTGAIIMSLLATSIFTATAKFLPSQSPAMSARMGSIIEGGGANLGRGDDPSTDYYVALVQSPTFLQTVVARPLGAGEGAKTLIEIYGIEGASDADRAQRAAERLGRSVNITSARASSPQLPRIITLECNATSATLAADICSAILEEIKRHNNEVRGSKAKQNREFVQSQLDTAKTELDQATEAFATFTARNRKIVSPALEADRDRLERLVRVKEDVYNTLSRQLVLARIEEQETRPSIEMIQNPEPPLVRSAPRRGQTVAVAGLVGLILGCVTALCVELYRRMDPTDPDSAEFRRNLAVIMRDARVLLLLGQRR